MKLLSFAQKFPSYHPRKGDNTYFVEKIISGLYESGNAFDTYNYPICKVFGDTGIGVPTLAEPGGTECLDCKPKFHTICAGHRWKAGDWFKPYIWGDDINPKSGRSGPYHSKHIYFAPPIEVKKVWDFEIYVEGDIDINGLCIYTNNTDEHYWLINEIAKNDGLSLSDFLAWFKYPKQFDGQIICLNDKVDYLKCEKLIL